MSTPSLPCQPLEQLNHRTETNHLHCKAAFKMTLQIARMIFNCLKAIPTEAHTSGVLEDSEQGKTCPDLEK